LSSRLKSWIAANLQAEVALEWFIVSNLAFLGGDIVVAHAENGFRRNEEWIPIVFSVAVVPPLLPGLFSARARAATRWIAIAIGSASVLVGVAGMLYHLGSSFFAARTLASLVYAAPFIAPLSYVGVGLLLILSRLEPPDSQAYPAWVLFLALGGFVGNFGLALTDHAQNGFFSLSEWIPVAGAAFMVAFLVMALAQPSDHGLERIILWLLLIESAIGVFGFLLHLFTNVKRPGGGLVDKVVFGAPPFAPLLFVDLSVLVAIGLWARRTTRAP
jgi:hypothetical protein